MKVCHVFLDFETKAEVYTEIFLELSNICGVHETIHSQWILSCEHCEYDFQVWDGDASDITWINPDVTYYFHDNKGLYPKSTREIIDKLDKNNVIWVESH